MQTVILAAGKGTRMGPLTDSTPKPMLPVADRPLLAHVADTAIEAGATELILVIGYEGESIRSYFGESYDGVPVTYVVQSEQAGTADAVRTARSELDGEFAVLNGDNLYDAASITEMFSSGPALATSEVESPSNYGVVFVSDEIVTDIVEKPENPPTNLANAGAYVFPEDALEYLDVPKSQRGEHEITDVVARVIDEFEVTPVGLKRWRDIGRPWELLEANELVLADLERRVRGEVSDQAQLRGPVVVEHGAKIEPGTLIEGPAYVCSGTTVGPNAYVRGSTYLGTNTHVGNGVEIKNSVVRSNTNIPHISYVGDSVIGQSVNFGAGTNVANLRHDDEDISIQVKGEHVSTERRKFGVVVGDGVKTGINTSLQPGITLSADARTDPGERVARDR